MGVQPCLACPMATAARLSGQFACSYLQRNTSITAQCIIFVDAEDQISCILYQLETNARQGWCSSEASQQMHFVQHLAKQAASNQSILLHFFKKCYRQMYQGFQQGRRIFVATFGATMAAVVHP